MKILVLGGTKFLGRHMVERFAECGHAVVAFHRGRTMCDLPAGVEERFGERNDDLGLIDDDLWDAVVDIAASEPDQVRRSRELHTKRYLFVSTVNVYEDLSKPGIREDCRTIETFDSADEGQAYGGKKAICERLVLERFTDNAILLRPGLIVGKWDPSGRFTYWCKRLLRGGAYLAPLPKERPVQLIDAADIARFAERALANDVFGTYNMVGPLGTLTMEHMLEACARVAAERNASPARAVWVDREFLDRNGVAAWTDMPLWLNDAAYAGILQVSNAAAVRAGLKYRAVADTIRAILDWAAQSPDHRVAGLSAEREAPLLAEAEKTTARH
ncbi:MAG: NAD-dependent epimerase/dehydratase family protein [Candidatus Tumulicola sp.]